MKLLKPTKLNTEAFIHVITPLIVVLTIALVGTYVLVKSHADPITNNDQSTNTSTPKVEHVSYAAKGPPPQLIAAGATLQKAKVTDNGGSCFYGACYYYVSASIGTTSALGASVSITQGQPVVSSKDAHSLTELSVNSEGTGGANTIEIGWTVDPGLNGDSLPHLFVYHWVNGASTCYNGCGFVPLSTTYTAGGPVSVGAVGTYSIKYTNSEWLLSYDGSPLGYFPESIWGGNFTSIYTTSAFGEVASASYYEPQTQMGNGYTASSASATVISKLKFIDIASGSTTTPMSISDYEAPSAYTYKKLNSNSFRYGGPGYAESSNPYVNLSNPTFQSLTATETGDVVTIPGDTASSMNWNWGDGSVATYPITQGVAFSESHTYALPGTYTVEVTSTDSASYATTTSQKVVVP